MTTTFWKRRLERLGEQFSKCETVGLSMIRDAKRISGGASPQAILADLLSDAVSDAWHLGKKQSKDKMRKDLRGFESHDPKAGSIYFYSFSLLTLPNVDAERLWQELRKLFRAAGEMIETIPTTIKQQLSPTTLTFTNPSIRWAGCVFDLALRLNRVEPSTLDGAPPGCWFTTLPNVLMNSAELIDWLIAADDVPKRETEGAAGDNDEQTPAEPEHVFRPDGDGYDITFHDSGHVSAVRCKGLHQIHRLIQTPMVPVLMTELEGASFVDPHSHQDIADQATLKDVAAKLRDAKSELERATASQDRDTIDVEHCRQEVEKWEGELGKLLGLRGQVRDLNNPYDKKRPKIWGTIETAKQRLRDFGHSELADHLDGSIESERAWFVYVPKLNPIPNWKTEKKDASLRP